MARTTSVLQVSGMSCGHCELSVKEALGELPGVARVEADHATGRAEVSCDEDRVGGEQFGRAVEEAGYTLESVGA